MNRRTLLTGSAAVATVAAVAKTSPSVAASGAAAGKGEFSMYAPRGREGMYRRLPSLDVQSNQEFLTDIRAFAQGGRGGLTQAARDRVKEILAENGHGPYDELPMDEVIALVENDPTVMASARVWLTNQQLTWKGVRDAYYADPDRYLQELKDAERAGPGSLELRPDMYIPAYAKHEIHIQPGGYVGDPLAGYIYEQGLINFFLGHNKQDQNQTGVAAATPIPADGKVKRVLEIGCSVGQLTGALKRRFPDAEVWGIDVGGPMVHYAHMRSADQGLNVNYRQALGEDSGFPDDYFDVVVSYIILHEIPNQVNTELMKEISRITRGGGVYYPVDFYTSFKPPKDAYGKFRRWWDHRWNGEPWALEHMDYDLAADLRAAGMTVNEKGPSAMNYNTGTNRGRPNLMATKA